VIPELATTYATRFAAILEPLAERLHDYLARLVVNRPRIDRVSVRAKGVDSFLRKAGKQDKTGAPEYAEPLSEIQDQIGARITTFYLRDVVSVQEVVEGYFGPIEKCKKEPDSHSEFGYEGFHYILFLPDDIFTSELLVPEAPKYFELQIKTLFQHAWSESAHDLIYKPDLNLTRDQHRRGAFTAAQAWGADRIFDELAEELGR
jgi:ppGpp synthetase/RelA/SpoT-type nucleotidyltranferase